MDRDRCSGGLLEVKDEAVENLRVGGCAPVLEPGCTWWLSLVLAPAMALAWSPTVCTCGGGRVC